MGWKEKEWSSVRGCFRIVWKLGPIMWLFVGVWLTYTIFMSASRRTLDSSVDPTIEEQDDGILSRQKRLIFMDNDRRLRLPPSSSFTFSFIITFPFWSNLPTGYVSGLTIGIPVTVKFDDLGWTSETNRFGYFDLYGVTTWDYSWLDIFGLRHFNWTSLDIFNLRDINMTAIDTAFRFPFRTLYDYMYTRRKRDVWEDLPGVNYDAGDRELVYQILEDTISNLGQDGQSCLLRFICEIHEEPLPNYGFFGEVLMLLSTPSLSPLAEYRLGPYLQAEKNGKLKRCAKYRKICKFTFFEFDSRYYRGNTPGFYSPEVKKNQPRNESDLRNSTSGVSAHHREKRFIYFGPHRRILWPPSTVIVLTPSMSLPFARGLKKGFSSGLSISSPFTIAFDALKYTSKLNRFGYLPFEFKKKYDKRDVHSHLPPVAYAGGDRQLMYTLIEDNLRNLGFDGESCLLRTICELHQIPLLNHGLFGELFELLLTPSLSPFPGTKTERYVSAEKLGKHCGDCSIFEELCPSSLFTAVEYIISRYSTWQGQEDCKLRHSQPFIEENMTNRGNSSKTENFSNSRNSVNLAESPIEEPSPFSINELKSNYLHQERPFEVVERVFGDSFS